MKELSDIELQGGVKIRPVRELIRVDCSLGFGVNGQPQVTGVFCDVVYQADGSVYKAEAAGQVVLAADKLAMLSTWPGFAKELLSMLQSLREAQDAPPPVPAPEAPTINLV